MVNKSTDCIERSIAKLLTEFCSRVDNGSGGTVANLFTDEATVETPHFNLAGRRAIHDWFSERAKGGDRISRHFWSNLRIEEGTHPDEYSVTANAMTFVGGPPAPCGGGRVVIGESADRIVLINDRPLFASRSLKLFFEGRLEPPETVA